MSLDLSKNYYELDIHQLLHSLRNLTSLHFLSLPRAVFRGSRKYNSGQKWPANLSSLEFNGGYPCDVDYWRDMMRSWPLTLTSLCLKDCDSSTIPLNISSDLSMPQISNLCLDILSHRTSETQLLLKACQNVVGLRLPASLAVCLRSWSDEGGGQFLQTLRVTSASLTPNQHIAERFVELDLWTLAAFPRLWDVYAEASIFDAVDQSFHRALTDCAKVFRSRTPPEASVKAKFGGIKVYPTEFPACS